MKRSVSASSISSCLNSGDLYSIVTSALDYPENSDYVVDYLLWDYNGVDAPYSRLCQYRDWTESNSLIQDCFKYYIRIQEDTMLEEMSDLDLDELRLYYELHSYAHDFLDKVLDESFTLTIDEGYYLPIRDLHRAFSETKFSAKIDSVYFPLRDSLQAEMNANLKFLRKNEEDVVSAVKAQTAYDVDSFVAKFIADIITSCINKKLPRIDSWARNRINSMYSELLPQTKIDSVINGNVKTLIKSISDARDTVAMAYLPRDYQSVTRMPTSTKFIHLPAYQIEMNEFMELSDIQREINWVSVGLTLVSTAAGVATGGGASAAAIGAVALLDCADFVYGIVGDNKKDLAVQEKVESIVNLMFRNMSEESEKAIESTFNALEHNLSTSFNVYEGEINSLF